jgi:hypothetical protein
VLDGARVAEAGSREELLARDGRYGRPVPHPGRGIQLTGSRERLPFGKNLHYPERGRGSRARSVEPSQLAGGTVLFICMMNIDLTGQRGIVTGASRGIGPVVTRALAGSGEHVIAGARHSSAELDRLPAEGTVTIPNVGLGTPSVTTSGWPRSTST